MPRIRTPFFHRIRWIRASVCNPNKYRLQIRIRTPFPRGGRLGYGGGGRIEILSPTTSPIIPVSELIRIPLDTIGYGFHAGPVTSHSPSIHKITNHRVTER